MAKALTLGGCPLHTPYSPPNDSGKTMRMRVSVSVVARWRAAHVAPTTKPRPGSSGRPAVISSRPNGSRRTHWFLSIQAAASRPRSAIAIPPAAANSVGYLQALRRNATPDHVTTSNRSKTAGGPATAPDFQKGSTCALPPRLPGSSHRSNSSRRGPRSRSAPLRWPPAATASQRAAAVGHGAEASPTSPEATLLFLPARRASGYG